MNNEPSEGTVCVYKSSSQTRAHQWDWIARGKRSRFLADSLWHGKCERDFIMSLFLCSLKTSFSSDFHLHSSEVVNCIEFRELYSLHNDAWSLLQTRLRLIKHQIEFKKRILVFHLWIVCKTWGRGVSERSLFLTFQISLKSFRGTFSKKKWKKKIVFLVA